MIILILYKLISKLNCGQLTHVDHVCGDNITTEQAGLGSGTLTFDGKNCEITITDIPELWNKNKNSKNKTINKINRLNIIGVRKNDSCNSSQLLIDSETYCTDESVKDTVINVTDQQMKFTVESTQPEPFILSYYRGEPLKFDVHISLHN